MSKFNFIVAGQPRALEADSAIAAARLGYDLMGYKGTQLIDIEDADWIWTFEANQANVIQLDKYPQTRLVEVTVVVRVPVNEDVEEFLNDVSFDCMKDGEDIYERTEGYTPIGEPLLG